MAISKEKMKSITKDFEKLNANLEGLSEEEIKEVAAGVIKTDKGVKVINLFAVYANKIDAQLL